MMIAVALVSLALLGAAPVLAARLAPHPETGTFDGLAEAIAALDHEAPEDLPNAA